MFEWFSRTQLLRIARSKGSKRLDTSFLKMEAEPASETYCFSACMSVTQWTKSNRRKIVSVCIHYSQNLTVWNLHGSVSIATKLDDQGIVV